MRVGLDLGSSYTKGVMVDDSGEIVDHCAVKTGYDYRKAANEVLERLSRGRRIDHPVYSCGYGREHVGIPFVANSEIIALARAVFERYRRGASVIDIGGQDTKYVEVDDRGVVEKFKLNRKCAAGTGAFLEEIAFRLGITAEEFAEAAKHSQQEIRINSFCTVFAVSEIVGLIQHGAALADITRGVYRSIVTRCLELAPVTGFLVLTGGVPERHPLIESLFRKQIANVECPKLPQFLAAYGCVLLGLHLQKA